VKDVTDDLNDLATAAPDKGAKRPRHFLDIKDLDAATLRDILTTASVCKAHRRDHARWRANRWRSSSASPAPGRG
jgi:hypothetical protein